MKKNNRIALWDNLKFLLIFLVVLGHFVDYHTSNSLNMKRIFFYTYIFHMPLFIFISGLFSKKTINEKKYIKIFEYLILYFALKIFYFIINIIIYKQSSISFFSEGNIPWFVLSLFFFHIITIFLKKLNPKYLLFLTIILACFIGYDPSISDLFALSRTIVFYPFFLAGYYLDPNNIINFCKQKKIKIISFLLIILSLIVTYLFISKIYVFRPLITGRNPFYTLGKFYKFGFIIRFIYYIITSLFIISIIALTPKQKTITTNWGARSLQTYILHYPCILVFYELLNGHHLLKLTESYLSLIQIALLLTILLSQKCFEKPINLIKTIKLNNTNT